MKLRLALAAAGILAMASIAYGNSAATGIPHVLLRATSSARPPEAPPLLFAAALDLRTEPRSLWDDRLLKIRQGGYNVAHLLVPWPSDAGSGAAAANVGDLLDKIAASKMRAILGPPPGTSPGDWQSWLAAILPGLQKHPESILWLQVEAGVQDSGVKALTELAAASHMGIPVVQAAASTIRSAPDAARPYREPDVGIALRQALAEGATALTWENPFAGVAPPVNAAASEILPPAIAGHEVGGLPLAYYEARLFGQVLDCLGAPLAEAAPAAGASADVADVAVAQRNAGSRGFLFARTPDALLDAFHLSFTDPATGDKVTVPRQEGLAMRSFGAGARVLPLNMPVPGATIRYSTAEVYGVYRLGGRTVILLTDDDGAPNEIALKLETDRQPEVLGAAAEPVWDSETRTLTLGYVVLFTDTFITIGDNLMLAVVPTERAQRTWPVRHRETIFPVITYAYFVGEEKADGDNLLLPVFTQQGKAAIIALLGSKLRSLTVNGSRPKVSYSPASSALLFHLESPALAGVNADVPVVQVLDQARFRANPDSDSTDCALPEYQDSDWSLVKLGKSREPGWYRIRFRLPAIGGWRVPWKMTLQVKGKATVALNGSLLGTVTGGGDKAAFAELTIPQAAARIGSAENLLAVHLAPGSTLQKIGIAPFAEHAVARQDILFTWM